MLKTTKQLTELEYFLVHSLEVIPEDQRFELLDILDDSYTAYKDNIIKAKLLDEEQFEIELAHKTSLANLHKINFWDIGFKPIINFEYKGYRLDKDKISVANLNDSLSNSEDTFEDYDSTANNIDYEDNDMEIFSVASGNDILANTCIDTDSTANNIDSVPSANTANNSKTVKLTKKLFNISDKEIKELKQAFITCAIQSRLKKELQFIAKKLDLTTSKVIQSILDIVLTCISSGNDTDKTKLEKAINSLEIFLAIAKDKLNHD